MIRLRMALTVLLAACFLLVQGGVVAVYSSGVSISVSSTTIGNTSNQTWGNQTSSSTPCNTTTSTTTAGTQNISSYSTTSSVISTSSNSSISSSQQAQQQPNTTDNLFQTLEQTRTSKLIPMPNLNPLSEGEPLLPTAASYAVTACLSYNDLTASGCSDKKTPSQASEILAAMILNKYLKGTEVRPFRVVLPSSMPLDRQNQLLRKIETDAIAIIEAGMLENLKSSKVFLSATEEGRHQKQIIIIENAKRAIQEADSGANWSHNTRDDRTSHDFLAAKAFCQFDRDISVAQWRSH